jgi:hypothetical protein
VPATKGFKIREIRFFVLVLLIAIVATSCIVPPEPSAETLKEGFYDKQQDLNYLVDLLQENDGEMPTLATDRQIAESVIEELELRDSSPYLYRNGCDIRFSVYAWGFTDVGKEKGYAYLCSIPDVLVKNVDDYSGDAPWYESHQHLDGNWYVYRLVFP